MSNLLLPSVSLTQQRALLLHTQNLRVCEQAEQRRTATSADSRNHHGVKHPKDLLRHLLPAPTFRSRRRQRSQLSGSHGSWTLDDDLAAPVYTIPFVNSIPRVVDADFAETALLTFMRSRLSGFINTLLPRCVTAIISSYTDPFCGACVSSAFPTSRDTIGIKVPSPCPCGTRWVCSRTACEYQNTIMYGSNRCLCPDLDMLRLFARGGMTLSHPGIMEQIATNLILNSHSNRRARDRYIRQARARLAAIAHISGANGSHTGTDDVEEAPPVFVECKLYIATCRGTPHAHEVNAPMFGAHRRVFERKQQNGEALPPMKPKVFAVCDTLYPQCPIPVHAHYINPPVYDGPPGPAYVPQDPIPPHLADPQPPDPLFMHRRQPRAPPPPEPEAPVPQPEPEDQLLEAGDPVEEAVVPLAVQHALRRQERRALRDEQDAEHALALYIDQGSAAFVVNVRNVRNFDVYVGRPNLEYPAATLWGNFYHMPRDGDRDEVVARYRAWLLHPVQLEFRNKIRDQLKGKRLGCWCHPHNCHARVLVDVAFSPAEQPNLPAPPNQLPLLAPPAPPLPPPQPELPIILENVVPVPRLAGAEIIEVPVAAAPLPVAPPLALLPVAPPLALPPGIRNIRNPMFHFRPAQPVVRDEIDEKHQADFVWFAEPRLPAPPLLQPLLFDPPRLPVVVDNKAPDVELEAYNPIPLLPHQPLLLEALPALFDFDEPIADPIVQVAPEGVVFGPAALPDIGPAVAAFLRAHALRNPVVPQLPEPPLLLQDDQQAVHFAPPDYQALLRARGAPPPEHMDVIDHIRPRRINVVEEDEEFPLIPLIEPPPPHVGRARRLANQLLRRPRLPAPRNPIAALVIAPPPAPRAPLGLAPIPPPVVNPLNLSLNEVIVFTCAASGESNSWGTRLVDFVFSLVPGLHSLDVHRLNAATGFTRREAVELEPVAARRWFWNLGAAVSDDNDNLNRPIFLERVTKVEAILSVNNYQGARTAFVSSALLSELCDFANAAVRVLHAREIVYTDGEKGMKVRSAFSVASRFLALEQKCYQSIYNFSSTVVDDTLSHFDQTMFFRDIIRNSNLPPSVRPPFQRGGRSYLHRSSAPSSVSVLSHVLS